jgi:hypothetical protein
MPTASNGHEQVIIAAEIDGAHDIRHIQTTRDELGMPVDHTIVNLAGDIIVRIMRLNERPAQTGFEFFYAGCLEHEIVPSFYLS